MRAILNSIVIAALIAGPALGLGGCAESNEASVAGTKGTAPADAPKSQADYYNQQKDQAKAAKGKPAAAK